MPHDRPQPAFKPYIPASANLPEMTPRALSLATSLGMVFGASSPYPVVTGGLTGGAWVAGSGVAAEDT